MFEEDGERIYLASKSRLTATGNSVEHRGLRSYGSCGSRAAQMTARVNIRIVKHKVQRGDTLQGIALKYGVTMEDVKRENRLWTTDSLFLREFLDIPVVANPGEALPTGRLQEDSAPATQRSVPLDNQKYVVSDETDDQSEENIRDFLGRIDTSIEKTKCQIKELNVPEDDDDIPKSSYNGLTLSPATNTVSYQNGYSSVGYAGGEFSNGRSYASVDFSPKTTIVTSGRKVTTSLQRHRREHEQMFEL